MAPPNEYLEERSASAVDQAVIATTPEGVVVAWNPNAETLYGWTADEAIGRNIVELTPSEHGTGEAEAIMKTLRAGESWTGEFLLRRKDGSEFLAFVSDTPVFDDAGEIMLIVGVSHNAANRRVHERDVEREAAMLRLALDAASIGTWSWDITAGRATWDAATATLFGLPPDALEFGSPTPTLHPDDAGRVMDAVEVARRDGSNVEVEFRVIWPDDSIHWLIARGRLVNLAGSPDGMIGIVADIEPRKRAEAALVETGRLRAAQDRRAIEVLQEALIRPDFPAVANFDLAARYLPADSDTGLGGDWYDTFELFDGSIMIGVGDVSGHGIRATRLMAKLRHATRAYACIDPDPTFVLRELDRFLQHFGVGDEFATVQLLVIDPVCGAYELVSAGHPPPIHFEGDHASILSLVPTPPIGMGLLPETITPHRDTLDPGQALVLYTDGLVERHDESLDTGLERLTQSLARAATSDELCDAALAGCLTGVRRNDDICVLAIRHDDS